jgi:hypothetical protein
MEKCFLGTYLIETASLFAPGSHNSGRSIGEVMFISQIKGEGTEQALAPSIEK